MRTGSPRMRRLRSRSMSGVSHYSLAGGGGSELPDGALYPVTRAIGPHRINRVVVRGPRRKTVHAHAKNRIGMAPVQSDMRFRRLTEILGIRAVTHDSVMLVGAPGIVARPPDNGRVFDSRFEFWPLCDVDMRGSRSGRLFRGTVAACLSAA